MKHALLRTHIDYRICSEMFRLAYLLTPWSRVLLQKLIGSQLVKKFPAFYGTRKFITVLTRSRHLSLSWARSIHSMPSHSTSWRSILTLFSHLCLGLPSGLFLSGFSTETLYKPLLSPIRATCPAYLILLDLITRTILGEEYIVAAHSLHSPLTSSLLGPVKCNHLIKKRVPIRSQSLLPSAQIYSPTQLLDVSFYFAEEPIP